MVTTTVKKSKNTKYLAIEEESSVQTGVVDLNGFIDPAKVEERRKLERKDKKENPILPIIPEEPQSPGCKRGKLRRLTKYQRYAARNKC
jgi:hypothetical protein